MEGQEHIFMNRLRFSLNLYKSMLSRASKTDNLLVSPLSAELAAVTAYTGAQGKTRTEIAEVLGLMADYTVERISDWLAQMIRDETKELAFDENLEQWCRNFELSSCVGMFVDESVRVIERYTESAQNLVNAACLPVPFASDPDGAWENVRAFITTPTKGKRPKILDSSKITPPTNLVLATTINFRSNWAEPFDENQTVKKWFTLASGAKIQVDTMHGTFTRLFQYHKSWRLHGAKILQLPYLRLCCKAYIILPSKRTWYSCPLRKDRLRHLEDLLTPKRLLQELSKVDYPHVVYAEIPKFCLQHTMAVDKCLAEMGMTTAFSADADLSGICTRSPLNISAVSQAAVFGFDENGSGCGPVKVDQYMFMSTYPQSRVKFIANRPFLFIVCHIETNTILLMGRVCNPLT
ncbi:alpha-1-antitrypsin-like [Paramacrobiotus metropolitanus]|uniref:alpha-1-antitrypsin-like n=1 Tax=Paramacrobiotus metropolitanus TaxID=2943436 RepID=UPI0024463A8D|nr:alpha-1-antitrypsin-like [Paramacrobiotus metropolitanus]